MHLVILFFLSGWGGAKEQWKPEDQKACNLDCPLHDSHACTEKSHLISSPEHLVLDDGISILLDAEDPYHTNYSQPSRNSTSDPKGLELHK